MDDILPPVFFAHAGWQLPVPFPSRQALGSVLSPSGQLPEAFRGPSAYVGLAHSAQQACSCTPLCNPTQKMFSSIKGHHVNNLGTTVFYVTFMHRIIHKVSALSIFCQKGCFRGAAQVNDTPPRVKIQQNGDWVQNHFYVAQKSI